MHIFSYKKEEKNINKEINKTIIEQIILEKYNQYYRLAYSYVHNETDAFDIVQNGAYKALREVIRSKSPSTPRPGCTALC